MDIMIHILLVIIIGTFFFIDKYNKTYNSIYVTFLLCIFGFIFLAADNNVEVVDYTTVNKINSSLYEYEKTDVTNNGVGIFDVQSFLVLIYFFFLMLAFTNIVMGGKDGN